MKKVLILVCLALLLFAMPSYSRDQVKVDGLMGKTIRVRLEGTEKSQVTCNWAMGIFEFSTILFEPNDDFKWHNHTSDDSDRVKLEPNQKRFQVRSKGIGITTVHRVKFIGGNIEMACKYKNKDGLCPSISVDYFSKKMAKKMVKYRRSKGIDAHMVKLDGHMVKLKLKPINSSDWKYYIVPENIVYYLSPFTTSCAIDISNVK
ncbi:hypothetical protein KAJ27_25545 [bacterium]|nr:hypothetical protein [bacterium]